jgi:TonB family protein
VKKNKPQYFKPAYKARHFNADSSFHSWLKRSKPSYVASLTIHGLLVFILLLITHHFPEQKTPLQSKVDQLQKQTIVEASVVKQETNPDVNSQKNQQQFDKIEKIRKRFAQAREKAKKQIAQQKQQQKAKKSEPKPEPKPEPSPSEKKSDSSQTNTDDTSHKTLTASNRNKIQQQLTQNLAKFQTSFNEPSTQTRSLSQANEAKLNQYKQRIYQAVRGHWHNPFRASNQSLSATVSVKLNTEGEVIARSLQRSSGNKQFDRTLLLAVERAAPFALPDNQKMREKLMRLKFVFKNR